MQEHYAPLGADPAAKPDGGFAASLFSRSAHEDLAQYSSEDLNLLASRAWDFLRTSRRPGAAMLRLYDPDWALAQISVLEIVNDDMPFLLDSALAELTAAGLDLRLVAHPIFTVERTARGEFVNFAFEPASGHGEDQRESFIHIHLGRIADEKQRADLLASLRVTFEEVRRAVGDREPMIERARIAVRALREQPPALAADEIAEAIQFLEWMIADNFVFLGERLYRFADSGPDAAPVFEALADSGLGILQDPNVKVLRRGRELVAASAEVFEFMRDRHVLIVAKANVKSRVHRRVYMDYIGLKRFDEDGRCIGELRIIGLFSASAYTQPTHEIPYIRHKAARVLEHLQLDPDSHSGRVLAATLETYPRDEMFQMDVETLTRFAQEVAALQDRPRLRVLTRIDRFDRFVSVLSFVPKDRFDTRVQTRLGEEFARIYEGRVSATYPWFPDGPLVRIHYIIGRDGGRAPDPGREIVEAAAAAVVRTWSDQLRDRLLETHGARGAAIAARWAAAFSAGYMEAFAPAEALQDIAIARKLSRERPCAVAMRSGAEGPLRVDCEVFSRERPIPLSERAPMLEAMGFNVVSERTFEIQEAGNSPRVWLHDMALTRLSGEVVDLAARGSLLETAAMAVLTGEAESDGYNALVLEAGLDWREVAALRALSRYLRQIGVSWSQNYMWRTLAKNPIAAERLTALFAARFDPHLALTERERAERQASIAADLDTLLRQVASLDEDRIIRRFLNLIQSAVRTNFFQRGVRGLPPSEIAVKFESRHIADLPLPRPLYEITVCSPRVEGIHLRFGKVARGGLRWSDRSQDFRTEILGLVKAQQVKNAVIVPVGGKGGFFAKKAPSPTQREAYLAEGVAAYRLFVTALLDLTDNLVGDSIAPPPEAIRYDGDDPYFVVAADKGTATFSDLANEIAAEHGFWLGDAFASGGSAGYDHKKMGITARGAWEAVKRHFREMDCDIQKTPFTVAGVGDMSGDVFGNGMLLSPVTRLVAAFDHRDIFLEPNPDPAISLAERQRLFDLPRSSWQDYDRRLLSKGGGVFSRAEKSIPLSAEAQALLGLAADAAAPDDVLAAILRIPVDLLWFGGIGTYVRASDETNVEVGDRANDLIRIAALDLRCKVIGEGANLGLTQKARIEAARRGVRLNTDSIDNSAGVNTSDVEVNIKIALSQPLRAGALDLAARDTLLHQMTDEVSALVLRNNYQQSLAISLVERSGATNIGFAIRLMQRLEGQGRLERDVEFLPSDDELRKREHSGAGLTRPEISILLAYAKLSLHHDLLASEVPDDPYLSRELSRYFPSALREAFPEAIATHRLRREIVATQLANAIVNRAGPTVIVRLADEAHASASDAVRAFAAVRDIFSLTELNTAVDALDGVAPGAAQLSLYETIADALLSRMMWFIRNVDFSGGIDSVMTRFKPAVRKMESMLDGEAPPQLQAAFADNAAQLQTAGAPAGLARRLAELKASSATCDLVLISEQSGRPLADCASAYFALDQFFQLSRLADETRQVRAHEHFERLALDRTSQSFDDILRRITAMTLRQTEASGLDAVEHWRERRRSETDRTRDTLVAILKGGLTLPKSIVAESQLSDLLA